MKLEDFRPKDPIVDLGFVAMEKKPILFARKVLAPKTAFFADNKISIIVMSGAASVRRSASLFEQFVQNKTTKLKRVEAGKKEKIR